jgi:hypothetical protein
MCVEFVAVVRAHPNSSGNVGAAQVWTEWESSVGSRQRLREPAQQRLSGDRHRRGVGQSTDDYERYRPSGRCIRQRSAACDLLVDTWASYEEEYQGLVEEFLAGPGSNETIVQSLPAPAIARPRRELA